MANFPILYTGKGTSKPLVDMKDPFKSFADKHLAAEQFKYTRNKEDEQFILDNAIGSETFISDKAMADQAVAAEDFKKMQVAMMAKKDGYLSMEDKLKITQARRGLEQKQKTWAASQQRWAHDRDLWLRDFGQKYDQEAFPEETAKFYKTGVYTGAGLQPRAMSVASYMGNIAKSKKDVVSDEVDAGGITTTETQYGTPEQAGTIIEELILTGEPGYRKKVFEDFAALSPEEKSKWFRDENEDGTISPEEESNGILEWAKQNPAYVDPFITEFKKTEPTSKSTSFNWNIGIGAGNNKNEEYDIKPHREVGIKFDNFVNLGRISYTSDVNSVDQYMDLSTGEWEKLPVSAKMKFDVIGYDPKTDVMVVRPRELARTEDGTYFSTRTSIGLKGSDHKKMLESKPFGLHLDSLKKKYGGATDGRKTVSGW